MPIREISKIASRWLKPALRRKGWIGCDMGSTNIRFAQLRREHHGLRIGRRWVTPCNNSIASEEMSALAGLQQLETSRNLSELFEETNVVATVPMHLSHCRSLAISMEQLENLESWIGQELSAELCVEPSELTWGIWPMQGAEQSLGNGSEAATHQTYDCLSVKSAFAHELGVRLLKIGLDCRAINPLPCAVASAMALSRGWIPAPSVEVSHRVERIGKTNDSVVAAGLHLGDESATFVIEVQGQPAFTRHLRSIRFRGLVEQTMEKCGLPDRPCVQWITNVGLPLEERSVSVAAGLGRHVLYFAENVAAEIHRTLKFIQQTERSLHPSSISLLGEGAMIRNLSQWLSARIQLSVRTWSLPGESSPDDPLFAIAAALSATKWELVS